MPIRPLQGHVLTATQAIAVAAALRAADSVGAVLKLDIPGTAGSPSVVFAGTGAIDIKRFAPFGRESYPSRAAFHEAYGLTGQESTAAPSDFNLATASVVGDSSYTPKRFFIEDGQGRLLKRAKSHRATHAADRYWLSSETAQEALDELRQAAARAI